MATTRETEDSLVFLYTSNLQGRQDIPRTVTHIRIANNVQILPVWALSKLTRLEQVEFSQNGVFQILGKSALLGCVSLKVLQLPPSTIEIRGGALAGCIQLARLHLNHGLVRILDSAFQHCRSLAHMHIPQSVKTLGNLAFHGCHSLCQVELPNKLQYLGRGVFMQCNSLQCIHIPSSIVYIGAYCFKDCFRLQSVEVAPTGLEVIRAEAFRNCPNVRNLCIPQETALEGGYANVFDPDTLLIAKHDDDIPDLDLDLDVEFLELKNIHQSQKPISIQNRYNELPMHRLCYYQAHWPSMKESQEGSKSIFDEMKELLTTHSVIEQEQLQDHVLMTPLHILALSTKPNFELWELVCQAFPDQLFATDKWGKEPLQYLLESSIEDDVAMERILHQAIPARLHHRLEFLGEAWRCDLLEWIQTLSMNTKSSRRSSANQILERRCKYERMEALSLLESAIWKVEWQRTLAMLQKKDTTPAVETEQSTSVESNTMNMSDDGAWEEARETCRIQCRSDVVVSNVLQYLDPVFKYYLRDPISLF